MAEDRMPEGNWLKKKRSNFTLSKEAREVIIPRLAEYHGVSGADVVELAVRYMHDGLFGKDIRIARLAKTRSA